MFRDYTRKLVEINKYWGYIFLFLCCIMICQCFCQCGSQVIYNATSVLYVWRLLIFNNNLIIIHNWRGFNDQNIVFRSSCTPLFQYYSNYFISTNVTSLENLKLSTLAAGKVFHNIFKLLHIFIMKHFTALNIKYIHWNIAHRICFDFLYRYRLL